MASITNPKEQGIWHELKELDFLNWFFSWFFLLLTQLSEPLMLLSTLYVIAETGVHAIASPGLHALAVGIMITAPEILLPGAFVKAAKTRDQGGRFSVLLYVMCWTFVGLTLLTLADLFIWHLSGTPLACLMYARCAAAVGYSILMRVMSHGHGQVLQVAVPDVLVTINELTEKLNGRIGQIEAKNGQMIAATEQQIVFLFGQSLQHLTGAIQDDLRQVKADVILEIEAAKPPPKMIDKPKPLTAFTQPDTDPLTDPELVLNTDLLTAYPAIASWLSTGRKTATLEEIAETSNRSVKTVKNRVAKGIVKRSGRNPNLYRIDSVILWLKEEQKSAETVKLLAVKVEVETTGNTSATTGQMPVIIP